MINYFGYGTLASPEMMEATIGRKPEGSDFHLENYELYIQTWAELPNHVQKILGKKWDSSFRSYFIRPSVKKRVQGKLWLITPEERNLVTKWEFWYEPIKIKVTIGDKLELETEIINNSSMGQTVSGEDYELFLNNKEKTLEAAKQMRDI